MAKTMNPQITWLLFTCLLLSASTLLAADATITVTKEQGGREIALKVGNILQIELPGKGGTGYLWVLRRIPSPPTSNSWTKPPKRLGSPGRDHR